MKPCIEKVNPKDVFSNRYLLIFYHKLISMNRTILTALSAIFFILPVFAQTKPVPRTFGTQYADLKTAWFAPFMKVGSAGKFQRMELGFDLPDDIDSEIEVFAAEQVGMNPFNPEDIDVQVLFTNPAGETKKQVGFYYKPFTDLVRSNADEIDYKNEYVADTTSFPWRVRFAPDLEGKWTVSIRVLIRNQSRLNYEIGAFTCERSPHKGRLTVSRTGTDSDRYLSYSDSKEPFFSIGLNVSSAVPGEAHPSQINRWRRTLRELSQVGGNFTRLEVGGQTGLPEWPVYNNYLGKLDDLYAFDQIIQACEDNGIYFVLFRHHIEVREGADWETVKWQNNPYKTGLNATPEEYFTKEEVIKWQNYSLRYLMARYCYSPNAAFYGYSELEGWYEKLEKDNAENGQKDGGLLNEADASKMLNSWIRKQQDYIRDELKNPILFCNTYASQASVISGPETDANRLSDIVGIHLYNSTKNANFTKRSEAVDKAWETYKKPVFLEEMGVNDNFLLIQCCTDIEFHNSIWASAFMGSFGTGLDWWWDAGIFDFKYHLGFRSLHHFFLGEQMTSSKYLPQRWSDTGNWKKRKVENYSLVSEDGLKAMGWVHNATYYWRNLAAVTPCIQNLVDGKVKENAPCHCAQDPSGSKNPYVFPRRYIDMYEHENTQGYNYEKIPDAYTEKGAIPIVSTDPKDNPEVKISGFKKSSWGKQKSWYRIEFYNTRTANSEPVSALTQRVSTSIFGQIRFRVPNLDQENPDYAYKIIYLGEGTTAQNAEIRLR